jgi:hypothetical protein
VCVCVCVCVRACVCVCFSARRTESCNYSSTKYVTPILGCVSFCEIDKKKKINISTSISHYDCSLLPHQANQASNKIEVIPLYCRLFCIVCHVYTCTHVLHWTFAGLDMSSKLSLLENCLEVCVTHTTHRHRHRHRHRHTHSLTQ